MGMRQRVDQLTQTMRDWRYRNAQDSFTRLNPTLDGVDRRHLIDARTAGAIEDENDTYEPADRRRLVITDRATQARAIAAARELERTERATHLDGDRQTVDATREGVER
jgi:hypothetical protein